MKRFILVGTLLGVLFAWAAVADAQVVYRSFMGPTATYSYYAGPRSYNAPLGYGYVSPRQTFYRTSTFYSYPPASYYGYTTPGAYYYSAPTYNVYSAPTYYARPYWGSSYVW